MKKGKSGVNSKVCFLLLIFGYFFLFLSNGEPFVRSDGFCNYHIAESIITQGNFISTSEPEYWNYMEHVKNMFQGKYVSVCSPGTSLIMLPGLSISHLFKDGSTITNDYYMAYNGHTLADGLAILITASILSVCSLFLTYRSLKLLKYSQRSSLFATGVVFLASYALWYVFIMPAFTHTYEIFAVSLGLYEFIRFRQNGHKKDLFLLGLACSLMLLIRPVLFPVAGSMILFTVFSGQQKIFTRYFWRKILILSVGLLLLILIYGSYNYVSYGKLIASGYAEVGNMTFDLNHFNLLLFWFNPNKGFFVFSPVYLLAVLGWFFSYKKDKALALISLSSFIIVSVLYSFWPHWWGGGSYGTRFLAFLFPLGAVGLAAFIERFRSSTKKIKYAALGSVIILSVFSTLILILYRFTDIRGSWFYSPMFLLKDQWKTISQSISLADYAQRNYYKIFEGSGLLKLFIHDVDNVITVSMNIDQRIVLKTFVPPMGNKNPPPQVVSFYLYDQDTRELWEYENVSMSEGWLEINLQELTPAKSLTDQFLLSVFDYRGFKFTTSRYRIYFKKQEHLVFKGDEILYDRAVINYVL